MMRGLERADPATLTVIERRWDWRTKIAGTLMLCVGLLPFVLDPTFSFFIGNQWFVFLIGPAFTLVWYLLNMHHLLPYRIAWDKDHIYMRDSGWRNYPFVAMPIADIDEIVTGYVENATSKAHFFPFDFIELHSCSQDNSISITPSLLYQVQLKDMLSDIYRVNPDIFPDDVVDYMNSTQNYAKLRCQFTKYT